MHDDLFVGNIKTDSDSGSGKINEFEIATFFARAVWSAHFTLTEFCNLKCKHCGGAFGPDKSRDYIKVKHVIDTINNIPTEMIFANSICLSGGEALTIYEKKPNYFNRIFSAAEKNCIFITLKTNGTIAQKPEFSNFMKDIEKFPNVRVDISINKFTNNCVSNGILIVNEIQRRKLSNDVNFTMSGYDARLKLAERLAIGIGQEITYNNYGIPDRIGIYKCRVNEVLQDSGRANENGLACRKEILNLKDYIECGEYRKRITRLEYCPDGTAGIMIGFDRYCPVKISNVRGNIKPLPVLLRDLQIETIRQYGN